MKKDGCSQQKFEDKNELTFLINDKYLYMDN